MNIETIQRVSLGVDNSVDVPILRIEEEGDEVSYLINQFLRNKPSLIEMRVYGQAIRQELGTRGHYFITEAVINRLILAQGILREGCIVEGEAAMIGVRLLPPKFEGKRLQQRFEYGTIEHLRQRFNIK